MWSGELSTRPEVVTVCLGKECFMLIVIYFLIQNYEVLFKKLHGK